jgi:cytochrome c
MKILLKIGILLLINSIYAFATTKEDVTNLIEDGVKLCKEKGIDVCLSSFNDKKGDFVKGSLYIFAINYEGITLAHGGNPTIVGKNLYNIKSPDGTMIFQEFINIAKTKGEGWIDYKWSNPETKQNADKSSFIKNIGNNILIGSGFYK